MFTEERQAAIELCLQEQGKVRVKELSEYFRVTEDCIRKDLKSLENAGKLKRTYGGAILSRDYPLQRDVVNRREYNLDKKKLIAEKALHLIRKKEKFYFNDSYKFAHLDDVSEIITDEMPDENIVKSVEAAGVRLI